MASSGCASAPSPAPWTGTSSAWAHLQVSAKVVLVQSVWRRCGPGEEMSPRPHLGTPSLIPLNDILEVMRLTDLETADTVGPSSACRWCRAAMIVTLTHGGQFVLRQYPGTLLVNHKRSPPISRCFPLLKSLFVQMYLYLYYVIVFVFRDVTCFCRNQTCDTNFLIG